MLNRNLLLLWKPKSKEIFFDFTNMTSLPSNITQIEWGTPSFSSQWMYLSAYGRTSCSFWVNNLTFGMVKECELIGKFTEKYANYWYLWFRYYANADWTAETSYSTSSWIFLWELDKYDSMPDWFNKWISIKAYYNNLTSIRMVVNDLDSWSQLKDATRTINYGSSAPFGFQLIQWRGYIRSVRIILK
jgi:hypothetical protein